VVPKERQFRGDLLRRARRRAGLTQRQLADRVGKSRTLIGFGETRDTLTDEVVKACARALGIAPETLYQDVVVGGKDLQPKERQVVEVMRQNPALADHIVAFALGVSVSNGLPREPRRGRVD
jgi:transcriptional regulator with XRE-family HTH domain